MKNKKEFNLSVKKTRTINCLFCGKEYQAKTRDGCCSPGCKINRKHLLEQEYRKTHKKEFAYWTREYAHNNQDKINAKAKKWYARNRDIALIRAETRNSNEKTGFCSDCKKERKTEFHHISYKPNIFIELCKECHIKRHGGILHAR